MAKQVYGFNADNTRRIVRAVRKSEREPPAPTNQRPRQRPIWTPWKAFKNNSSETVPAYGLIAITGREFPSEHAPSVLLGTKPDTTFRREYRINSSLPVEPNLYGSCMSLGLEAEVLYDAADGTPVAGECWGPSSDSWEIHKGWPGLTILGGVAGGTPNTDELSRVVAYSETINHLVGKADSNIAALSGAVPGSGTVSLWYRTTGTTTYADSTINITGKNFSAAVVTSAKFIQLKYFAGEWLVDFESCT